MGPAGEVGTAGSCRWAPHAVGRWKRCFCSSWRQETLFCSWLPKGAWFGDSASFLEYEEVLKRPEHQLAHGLAPPDAIDEFLELAALIEPVEVHFQWRPPGPRPNDEMVIEAASNGRGGCGCPVPSFSSTFPSRRRPILHALFAQKRPSKKASEQKLHSSPGLPSAQRCAQNTPIDRAL